MSISRLDLYIKHINGLRLEDEIYMRCLEEDTHNLNANTRAFHEMAKKLGGKLKPEEMVRYQYEVGKRKNEIDRGYEELKRRVMKEKKR